MAEETERAQFEMRKAGFAVDLSNYVGMCELADKPCDANAFNAGWLAHEARAGEGPSAGTPEQQQPFLNELAVAIEKLRTAEAGFEKWNSACDGISKLLRTGWPFISGVAGADTPTGPQWISENVEPSEKGWYAVRRADGSLCIRAWGNGLWWIPLKDGWLSGLPAGFSWLGPLAEIMWDTPRNALPASSVDSVLPATPDPLTCPSCHNRKDESALSMRRCEDKFHSATAKEKK